MSKVIKGRAPRRHLSESFIWDDNTVAYRALRCPLCHGHCGGMYCEGCCNTGIQPIPTSEVINMRVKQDG